MYVRKVRQITGCAGLIGLLAFQTYESTGEYLEEVREAVECGAGFHNEDAFLVHEGEAADASAFPR